MHVAIDQPRTGPITGKASSNPDEGSVIPAPWIARLRPYKRRLIQNSAELDDGAVLRLDSNEGLEPPQFIVDELVAFLRQPGAINYYPDEDCSALVRALSTYVARPAHEIVVFNGADGALEAIARAFLSPNDEAIVVAPSYDQFRVFVELAGARPRFVNGAESPLGFDGSEFLSGCRISPSPKLIYLVNPNNPAGYLIDENAIADIARAFPRSLVVVDETYIEFAADVNSSTTLLDLLGNVIVVRSFSKAFGLAGLRLGYVVASAATARILQKVRNGKSVTALSQIAGLTALANLEGYRVRFARMRATRQWFVRALRASGVVAHDSNANFILVETESPSLLAAALARSGVRARDLSWMHRLERYLRITIATPSQMVFVLRALLRIMDENPQTTTPPFIRGGY
jgi:histidinol-phosphate aminotransferase